MGLLPGLPPTGVGPLSPTAWLSRMTGPYCAAARKSKGLGNHPVNSERRCNFASMVRHASLSATTPRHALGGRWSAARALGLGSTRRVCRGTKFPIGSWAPCVSCNGCAALRISLVTVSVLRTEFREDQPGGAFWHTIPSDDLHGFRPLSHSSEDREPE